MLPCCFPPQHHDTGRFCPRSNWHFLVDNKYEAGLSMGPRPYPCLLLGLQETCIHRINMSLGLLFPSGGAQMRH